MVLYVKKEIKMRIFDVVKVFDIYVVKVFAIYLLKKTIKCCIM